MTSLRQSLFLPLPATNAMLRTPTRFVVRAGPCWNFVESVLRCMLVSARSASSGSAGLGVQPKSVHIATSLMCVMTAKVRHCADVRVQSVDASHEQKENRITQ